LLQLEKPLSAKAKRGYISLTNFSSVGGYAYALRHLLSSADIYCNRDYNMG